MARTRVSTVSGRQEESAGQPGRPRRLSSAATPLALATQALLALALAITLASHPSDGFFIDEHQSPATHQWNYADQLNWPQAYRDCSGRAQSPIDIQHKNVIISQHLKLHFYNYNQPLKFKLSNAHHTIKMNPTGTPAYDLDEAERRASVAAGHHHSGSANGTSIHDIITADEYVEFTANNSPEGATSSSGQLMSAAIQQQQQQQQQNQPPLQAQQKHRQQRPLNGSRNNSAHKNVAATPTSALTSNQLEPESHASSTGPNGEPYDGAPTIKLDWLDDGNNEYKLRDIHFHWGERRDNGSEHAIEGRRAAMEMHLVHIKHGLDKSKIGFTSDSVAVIAVLIESHRKSNADFNPIVNELARINNTETPQTIDYKSIYDVLPGNLDAFYTYSGSLTTPPCYQVVNWIVMAERLNMNAKQIEMFRNLYAPPESASHSLPGQEHESADSNPDESNRAPMRHSNHYHNNHITPNRYPGFHSNSAAQDEAASSSPSASQTSVGELIMPNVRAIQPLNNRTILASFTKHGSRLRAALSATSGPTSLKAILFSTPQTLCLALLCVTLSLLSRQVSTTSIWVP